MSMRERSRPLSESRMQDVGVRCYQLSDQEAVLPLAARLTIGIVPWLDPARFAAAAREWVTGSIARIGPEQAVFVAEVSQGEIVGFISVGRLTHFSGEPRAYIGELVVDEAAERHGVGRQLVAAAESWARERLSPNRPRHRRRQRPLPRLLRPPRLPGRAGDAGKRIVRRVACRALPIRLTSR